MNFPLTIMTTNFFVQFYCRRVLPLHQPFPSSPSKISYVFLWNSHLSYLFSALYFRWRDSITSSGVDPEGFISVIAVHSPRPHTTMLINWWKCGAWPGSGQWHSDIFAWDFCESVSSSPGRRPAQMLSFLSAGTEQMWQGPAGLLLKEEPPWEWRWLQRGQSLEKSTTRELLLKAGLPLGCFLILKYTYGFAFMYYIYTYFFVFLMLLTFLSLE